MLRRIVVADDHDVVRKGVRLILSDRPEWEVVAEAKDGNEAIDTVRALQPDLLVLDISMPGKGGLQVLGELAKDETNVKVLVLTMHESKELVELVARLGAAGCVNKTSAGRDLLRAIEFVFDGGTFFESEDA
jgi:two-component system, NarL family, response regulator NreC